MIEEIILTLIFASIIWLTGFATGYIRGMREQIKRERRKNNDTIGD